MSIFLHDQFKKVHILDIYTRVPGMYLPKGTCGIVPKAAGYVGTAP